MKIVINGVDVTNDCVVKNDTIIFCGGHWPPESLPSTGEDVQTPSASVGMEEAVRGVLQRLVDLNKLKGSLDLVMPADQDQSYIEKYGYYVVAKHKAWVDARNILTASTSPAKDNWIKIEEVLHGINVKREELLLPVNGNMESWDYLTVYDNQNNVLARSTQHHPEGTIRLEYKGLQFMATTLARNYGEDQIFIQLKSVMKLPTPPTK